MKTAEHGLHSCCVHVHFTVSQIQWLNVETHHFRSQDIDNLQHYPMFRDHAFKFMKVLETLVQNMEEPDVIQPHLVALGARHAAIDGYHPEYFRFYSKCLLEVWEMELGEEFISEVKDCWKYVIKYIVRCMMLGYDMCLTNQLDSFMRDSNFGKFDYT